MPPRKKKVAPVSMPPSKLDILARELFEHYMRCKEVGIYCIIDRSKGFHFSDVFKDGVWSYDVNESYDAIILAERLYHKDKCKMVKYPEYEPSEEVVKLYEEFAKYSSEDLGKVDFEGTSAQDRLNKTQEYISKINSHVPEIKEVDRLAYINGFNGALGFPVIPITDIPDEALKNISYKIAQHALSHFSTMSFLYDDDFEMKTNPIVVDPDEFSDIVITFSNRNQFINSIARKGQ